MSRYRRRGVTQQDWPKTKTPDMKEQRRPLRDVGELVYVRGWERTDAGVLWIVRKAEHRRNHANSTYICQSIAVPRVTRQFHEFMFASERDFHIEEQEDATAEG